MKALGFDLKGKAAVITGGTSVIGLAIAAAMLEAGGRVLVGSRGAEKVAAAERELAAGRDASTLIATQLDVAEPASFDAALTLAVERLGRVDILVNCAGA